MALLSLAKFSLWFTSDINHHVFRMFNFHRMHNFLRLDTESNKRMQAYCKKEMFGMNSVTSSIEIIDIVIRRINPLMSRAIFSSDFVFLYSMYLKWPKSNDTFFLLINTKVILGGQFWPSWYGQNWPFWMFWRKSHCTVT